VLPKRKECEGLTAKEYLQSVKIKDAEIDNLQSDKEALRDMMFSLGGNSDSERVQSSRDNDKFGSLYSRIDAKEREIIEKIDELIDFKLKVSAEINKLTDDRFIKVLHKRYIQYQSWEYIAIDMNYNVGYLYQVHGQALLAFEAAFDDMLKAVSA